MDDYLIRLKRSVRGRWRSWRDDVHWNCPGVSPRWIGSRAGGAWVDLTRLSRDSVVYSFGIANEISFDREIILRANCKVVGFDPDPRVAAWLKTTWVPPAFTFHPWGLAAQSGEHVFFCGEDVFTSSLLNRPDGKRIICRFFSLPDLMEELGHAFVDYVKMDIEGEEFNILKDWLATGYRPPIGQLWLETHGGAIGMSEKEVDDFVRELSAIGLVPARRCYRLAPEDFLLVNQKIMGREDVGRV